MAVVFVLINAVFVAASNVLGGVAARRLPVPIVVTIAGVTTIVVSLIVATVMPGTPSTTGLALGLLAGASAGVGLHFRGRHVLIPVAAGVADILGNLFLVLALQAGDLVLLAILAPAAPIFTAIIGRVFLRELMTRWQITGLVVASGALVLASL